MQEAQGRDKEGGPLMATACGAGPEGDGPGTDFVGEVVVVLDELFYQVLVFLVTLYHLFQIHSII